MWRATLGFSPPELQKSGVDLYTCLVREPGGALGGEDLKEVR